MKQTIQYSIAEDIIRGYQTKVGDAWNPFLMISDIMADPTIGPYISYVDIQPRFLMQVRPMRDTLVINPESAQLETVPAAGCRVLYNPGFSITYH